MQIPAQRLLSLLHFDGLIELRRTTGQLDSRVTCGEAVALAVRGEIEGVVSRCGLKLRYLRYLKTELIDQERVKAESYRSNSSVVARTNIGVYREEVTTAGNLVGYCYAFSLLRDAGV